MLAFFGERARAPPYHSGEITAVTTTEKAETDVWEFIKTLRRKIDLNFLCRKRITLC
jgi:hypothetical protein